MVKNWFNIFEVAGDLLRTFRNYKPNSTSVGKPEQAAAILLCFLASRLRYDGINHRGNSTKVREACIRDRLEFYCPICAKPIDFEHQTSVETIQGSSKQERGKLRIEATHLIQSTLLGEYEGQPIEKVTCMAHRHCNNSRCSYHEGIINGKLDYLRTPLGGATRPTCKNISIIFSRMQLIRGEKTLGIDFLLAVLNAMA